MSLSINHLTFNYLHDQLTTGTQQVKTANSLAVSLTQVQTLLHYELSSYNFH